MKVVFSFFALVLLAGCQTTQPLYYYGNYEELVYVYLKGNEKSLSEQVYLLNNIIQRAAEKNAAVAPGLHAHIGMLYFEMGDSTKGFEHFQLEKTQFPESAEYIDFLLTQHSEESK